MCTKKLKTLGKILNSLEKIPKMSMGREGGGGGGQRNPLTARLTVNLSDLVVLTSHD